MLESPVTGPGSIVCLIFLGIILFFRLVKTGINIVGNKRYHAVILGQRPAVSHDDCCVILPVINPSDPNLDECLRSILENLPQHLYIVTIGTEAQTQVNNTLTRLRRQYISSTQISVGAVHKVNKRRMIAHALSVIEGKVTVVTDQGVYWPRGFLRSALAPFDDLFVSAVAVPKVVRKPGSMLKAHWACILSLYYGFLADDNRAINALDRSALFGGSTVLFRTYASAEQQFRAEFENNWSSFAREGVLHGEEHCFFNCYFLQEPGRVVFQDVPDTTVQIEMTSFLAFMGEYIRTTHSTWSLSASMLHHKSRSTFPLSCFTTWLASFVSFTLVNDAFVIALAYFDQSLSHAKTFWIYVGAFMLTMQMLASLSTALYVRRSGAEYTFFTIFLCILLSFVGQYVLELLRIAAALTCWTKDIQVRIEADPEQAVDESNEPDWIWGSTQLMDSPRVGELYLPMYYGERYRFTIE
ncbi:hypothetical protein ACHAPU_007911 [Fusarium lateritium]